ncbi:MAG: T9SS type A sorting domain-containing protein [Bacteroidales bacterium]|nr:T9SS type A sorting domain-containing protein [Bacteroidales bacterium]
MTYINEDEFITFSSSFHPFLLSFEKWNDEGDVLDSVIIWPEEYLTATMIYGGDLIRFRGNNGLYYTSKPYNSDTLTFHKISIDDNLGLSFMDYQWHATDAMDPNDLYLSNECTNVIVNKDGGVILSYVTQNDSVHIARFDAKGNVTAERVIEVNDRLTGHRLIPAIDSLGCRIITIRNRPFSKGRVVYNDCFVFDSNLNIVDTIQNVDELSYPILCSFMADFRVNPYNGRIHSIGAFANVPAGDYWTSIVMSLYDEEMNQIKYVWGFHTTISAEAGKKHTIDFSSENEVYLVGTIRPTPPWGDLYIAYTDGNLNIQSELYFIHPKRKQCPTYLIASPNGGCLISTTGYNTEEGQKENCIYKADFMDIDEAHTHGFAVATAYPNPGKDVLNIRTALKDARVEVYDMNGRLIHSQALTENVTAIDAAEWAKGVYVWKVYTSDGGPSTGSGTLVGSTTLAETGKWVKE